MTHGKNEITAIVIGSSAGGLHALEKLLAPLSENFPAPIIVAQHRSKGPGELFEEVLRYKCRIAIVQAEQNLKIEAGNVYCAPPGYHLLIEERRTFSLSTDEHETMGTPSINVLFETAAEAYREKLAGIILTGANSDGAQGIGVIHAMGGVTIAQSPREAQYPFMPQAAINTSAVRHIWTFEQTISFLKTLDK